VSALLTRLHQAVQQGQIAPLELALADWCLRAGSSEPVALGMALTARAVNEGHSCLVLSDPGPAIPGESAFCSPDSFLNALQASPLVGAPGASCPMILDGHRLYLHRYWAYESRLASRLQDLLARDPAAVDTTSLERNGGLFDYSWVSEGEPQWQAVAAAVALRHRFVVISGGPGTGKTYTVLRLIRLLVQAAQAVGHTPPVIRLAAPTGKAAARMMESIRAGLTSFASGESLREWLPDKATTLHRLLGLHGGTVLPRHDRDNPLAADVVIVDEASMIDLPMMAKLADALPDHGRLILLGDRYQLASVESGSVLAELCSAAGLNNFSPAQCEALSRLLPVQRDALSHLLPVQREALPGITPSDEVSTRPALADHVITLQTSHRFHPRSPIGRLASAVNVGNAEAAIAVGREGSEEVHIDFRGSRDLDSLTRKLAEAYTPLLDAVTPEAAVEVLDSVRLLTATRIGPTGAIAMNLRIFEHLARQRGLDNQQRWYHGRPVVVLQNDYRIGLSNGDTGVCQIDADGHVRVWFRTEAGLLTLLPSAMPAHETAFVMTVHKSQGSEFDRVWLLLPPADSPVLSRELIYTGITRAKTQLTLLGAESVFRSAVTRVIHRDSGLASRLLR
jgi:exodeoxyribonuclease V alpha subunit